MLAMEDVGGKGQAKSEDLEKTTYIGIRLLGPGLFFGCFANISTVILYISIRFALESMDRQRGVGVIHDARDDARKEEYKTAKE